MRSCDDAVRSCCPQHAGHRYFFSAVTFAAKQRELPQQPARRDRFPGHVLGHCKANDGTGSGTIVQSPNDVLRRHPPAWHMGLAYRFIRARRCYNTTRCHHHGSSDTFSCILRIHWLLASRPAFCIASATQHMALERQSGANKEPAL